MRDYIKRFYEKSQWGFYIIHPLVSLYRFFQFQKYRKAENYLISQYKRQLGKTLNIDDPQSFNEKMNWLKVNYFTDTMTVCADKFKVREYVKERIGDDHLIPVYYHTTAPTEIRPENVPDEPCIIKVTHNSSGGVIVRQKKEVKSWHALQNSFRHKMHDNYYWHSREPQYRFIEPRIIIEKLLTTENGSIPADFKLHYFNGKIQLIQVDSDRMTEHKRTLYTPDWEVLPFSWEYPKGVAIPRPANLDTMIDLGQKLAAEFPYARVDFYDVKSKVYFGEITFHADGGMGRFDPPEFDLILGKELSIPK